MYQDEDEIVSGPTHWQDLSAVDRCRLNNNVEMWITRHVFAEFPLSLNDLSDEVAAAIHESFSRNLAEDESIYQIWHISSELATLLRNYLPSESLYEFKNGTFLWGISWQNLDERIKMALFYACQY
jgi:hypothetical protein